MKSVYIKRALNYLFWRACIVLGIFDSKTVLLVFLSSSPTWRKKKTTCISRFFAFSRYEIFGNLLMWVSCILFFSLSLLSFLILFIYFRLPKWIFHADTIYTTETITTPSKRHSPTNKQTDRKKFRNFTSLWKAMLWKLNFRCTNRKWMCA